MVMPERETPGTSAIACATPTSSAEPRRISASWASVLPQRSAAKISNAPPMSIKATIVGSRSSSSIVSPKARPATAAGTVPTKIQSPSRACSSQRETRGPWTETQLSPEPAMRSQSRQK